MLQDLLARRRGFAEFVQASRYKTEGVSGVGLKELLMEPVQRIPRYTMMWSRASSSSPLSSTCSLPSLYLSPPEEGVPRWLTVA